VTEEQRCPEPDLAGLERLLSAQRFTELRDRLENMDPTPEQDAGGGLLRLCGELAWRGHAPLSDVLLAARQLVSAGDPAGPAMAAHGARAAARAGALTTAWGALRQASERWPEDDALRLATEQIESGTLDGHTRQQWTVERLIAEGDQRAAREQLELLAQHDAPAEERQRTLLRLADLLRAAGEHGRASKLLLEASELFPEADRAVLARLGGALLCWAAGQGEAARELLKGVREATADAELVEGRYAHRVASEVLERLDRDPEQSADGPRWVNLGLEWNRVERGPCPGRAAASLALSCFGRSELLEGDPLPSMAHLRHSLQAQGLVPLRIVADEGRIEAALRERALLILEEERPTDTGFLLVVGFDPVAGLLLLKDPQRLAPLVRNVENQWRRSALHGRSALLVLERPDDKRLEQLASAGLKHDERLDLVDGCDLDPSGRVPSQARVAALAEEAITEAPEFPVLHKRHGESLLAQLRMGNIEPAPAGPFERWLSATRVKFPDAEWPFQIYAGALEAQERYDEAGIAWADATSCDPYDERNFLGQAAVLAKQGRLRQADRMLRRVLTLRPEHVEAHTRRGEIALAEERVEHAALHAGLAVDIAPDNVRALLTKATVDEQAGRLDEAFAVLARVVREEPEHAFARVRLLRRHAHRGEWQQADRLAAEVCTLAPGVPAAWETASWIAWSAGEGERALTLAMTGLQRCGPDGDLVDTAIRAITTQLSPERAQAAIDELADLLRAAPPFLLNAASELAGWWWHPEGMAVAEMVRELLPNDPNPTWRLVQIMLSNPAVRREQGERIDQLLEETVKGTGDYPLPRVVLGWRRLEKDPAQVLELMERADSALAPAPVWYLQARAMERVGRQAEAEQVRARLPEVFPAGVLEPVGVLRLVGLTEMASDLLQRLLTEQPDNLDAKVELARTAGADGDRAKELALLLEVEAVEPHAVPASWLRDAAEASGDWSVLERAATRFVEEVERDSSSAADVWAARAQLAVARLAQEGGADELQRVVDLAPRHPDVLTVACRVLRQLQHPEAEQHRQRLATAAPGALRTLEEREGAR
jgi:tetratricopeptide (TPR) repeat protein